MTIDEANKILAPYSEPPLPFVSAEFCDAIKLGREALERIQRLREDTLFDGGVSLPGETKD